MLDWSIRPIDELTKVEYVTKLWNQEKNYRPCYVECSPFYDDIVMTIHDFNFCIWKTDVD